MAVSDSKDKSNLLTHFRDLTKDLNLSKLYQISMDDGPKMNLKFFNENSSKFAENTLHSLINIGICNQQLLFMGASKLVNLHLDGV